jgi:hypothetical protein
MRTIVLSIVVLGAMASLAQSAEPVGPSEQPQAAMPPGGQVQPLWSGRTAGLVGGIAGSVLGGLGALIGILCGIGKGKQLVLILAQALLVLGLISLTGGIIALLMHQPYAVYYPLLLMGGILTLVIGLNFRTIRARFEQMELRKMQSMDAP